MLPFTEETRGFSGNSTARMHFRMKAPIKAIIQRVAALSGVDDFTFTMSAALREAERIIEAHEYTRLQAVDHAAFFAALDAPSEPGEALLRAAQRCKARVASP